jgi:hypothetical protein
VVPAALKAASAVAGTAVNALITAATGDAFAGSTAGAAFTAVVDDVTARTLSQREQHRVKTAIWFAANRIRDRWAAGEDLRDDDFFSPDYDSPGLFRELAEGVLVTAQREHEERKIRHLGYLIANLAFEPDVDRTSANWALRTARELSWTQYVLVALLVDEESEPATMTVPKPRGRQFRTSPRPDRPATWAGWSTWQEFEQLGPAGMKLLANGPTPMIYRMGKTKPGFNGQWPTDIGAKPPHLTDGAHLLHSLLSLDEIPAGELDRVCLQLDSDERSEGRLGLRSG